MHFLKSLALPLILSCSLLAQLPKAGSLILFVDGEIGIPLGGIISEENDFAELNTFDVIDDEGTVIESGLVPEYNHFNWSAGGGLDVFLGQKFALGLSGGYYQKRQELVAEENNLKDNTGHLTSLGAGHFTITVAIPTNAHSYVSLKLLGGYALGEITRATTLVGLQFDSDTDPLLLYYQSLNEAVDIAGPSAGFEAMYNLFNKSGVKGSLGIRYGMQYLTADPSFATTDPSYAAEETTINHTISATLNIGFGFKLGKRDSFIK